MPSAFPIRGEGLRWLRSISRPEKIQCQCANVCVRVVPVSLSRRENALAATDPSRYEPCREGRSVSARNPSRTALGRGAASFAGGRGTSGGLYGGFRYAFVRPTGSGGQARGRPPPQRHREPSQFSCRVRGCGAVRPRGARRAAPSRRAPCATAGVRDRGRAGIRPRSPPSLAAY